MFLTNLKNLATSKIGRQILLGRKHSPVILFAAGVVGVVATVVLSSRATLKLSEVVDEIEADVEDIQQKSNDEDYSDLDQKRDMARVYIRSALEITKLYGPAFVAGVVSIGCLAGSHVILTRRNAGLTAAYIGLDKVFKEYRRRVIDKIGEEEEANLRYASKTVETTEIDESGNEIKKFERVVDARGLSQYATLFGPHSTEWQSNPEYNRMFLASQMTYANDRLRRDGYLLLNDLLKSLGLPRTSDGAVVGWVLNKNKGDDYVSFGIYSGNVERGEAFVNGEENSVWLDFNVHGLVYHLIDEV